MKRSSRIFVVVFIFSIISASLFQLIIPARADALSSAKDTIGDSQPGVASTHTFVFTPALTTAIKTIDFKYCTSASGTCTAPTGMVLTATPTLGTVTGIDGTSYSSAGTNTTCTGTGNTDCTITLTVGTPATQTIQVVTVPFTAGITNPTSANTTTFVRITTKDASVQEIDAATVAFATLTSTSLTMSASVDPTFSFSLADVTSGSVNSQAINVTTGTSATTIPFGTLSNATPKIAAHDATVSTNAGGGFLVTVNAAANPPLTYGSNNLDVFTGTNDTPVAWSSPAGGTPNVNTGFVGYTTDQITGLSGSGGATRFDSNKWAGLTTTPGPVISSTTGGTNTTRIGWQAEVNNAQPAGSYSGTVIVIATPTY